MSDNELNIRNQLTNGERTDWFTILPTVTALAADTSSGEFIHPDPSVGLALEVITAGETGAWTATIDITTLDPAGNEITWIQSGAITTNTTTLILIRPGGGTNGLFTILPFPLPRVF